MTVQTFPVHGLTCAHCVHAVRDEIGALHGVTDVAVELVPGGSSSVRVTTDHPVSDEQVATALDEAGDYRLA
jgi:copper chaperone CopZ